MEKKVYDFPRYYEVIRNLQPQACISVCDEDFGSRKALENEKDLIWYPAEVNTSIRPGWFYHPEEDNGVRPLSELIDIYYQSVGGNATFLLNIPPSPLGLYHLSFGEAEIRHVVLQEDISKSQRVESFTLEINQNGKWESFYNGKVIGYKKIIRLENPVKSGQIRIKILDCRLKPVLKSIAVY